MQSTIGFKLGLYVSVFALLATAIFGVSSFFWRDDIPFQLAGVHYRFSSWQGEFVIDNEPQVALEVAPTVLIRAEAVQLVNEYKNTCERYASFAEDQNQLRVKAKQLMDRLASDGYIVFPPDPIAAQINSRLAPVMPIPIDAQGQLVFFKHPPAARPLVTFPVSYAFPACAAMLFPAIFVCRLLQTRFRRQHKLCVACEYDLRFSPERCPECGLAVHQPPSSGRPFFGQPMRLAAAYAVPLVIAVSASRAAARPASMQEALALDPIAFPPPVSPSDVNSDRLDFNTGLSATETGNSVISLDVDSQT